MSATPRVSGGLQAVLAEAAAESKPRMRWIFLPSAFVLDGGGLARRAWDIALCAAALFSAVVAPLNVAFVLQLAPAVAELIDVLFLIDVAANFFTSFTDARGDQEGRIGKIARRCEWRVSVGRAAQRTRFKPVTKRNRPQPA